MIVAINLSAQTKRSDDFRAKYQLKEVVVMSRHNIRSPLTSGGAVYKRVTPYEWFKWSSPSSQLSLRGGVLETEMGQFFRKWLVGEGLLPENYRPEGDEVLFYANSRQRTFATAKYFSAGFLPFANVEITWWSSGIDGIRSAHTYTDGGSHRYGPFASRSKRYDPFLLRRYAVQTGEGQ